MGPNEPTAEQMLTRVNRELRKAVDRLAEKCGGVSLCVVVDDKGMAHGDARLGGVSGQPAFETLFAQLRHVIDMGNTEVGDSPATVDNEAPVATGDTQTLDAKLTT